MARNLAAGREILTEEERQAIDAILAEGTPDAELRAFREQLRLVRERRNQDRGRG